MVTSSVYALLLLDIVLTVAAQLVLRIGAQRLAGQGLSLSLIFEPLKNSFLLLGIVLYAISFFLYVFILSKLQLNVVYPVATGTILILITLTSYFFFRETLGALQMLGITAILVGIFLVLLPQ